MSRRHPAATAGGVATVAGIWWAATSGASPIDAFVVAVTLGVSATAITLVLTDEEPGR